jgi:hypothetical protein
VLDSQQSYAGFSFLCEATEVPSNITDLSKGQAENTTDFNSISITDLFVLKPCLYDAAFYIFTAVNKYIMELG